MHGILYGKIKTIQDQNDFQSTVHVFSDDCMHGKLYGKIKTIQDQIDFQKKPRDQLKELTDRWEWHSTPYNVGSWESSDLDTTGKMVHIMQPGPPSRVPDLPRRNFQGCPQELGENAYISMVRYLNTQVQYGRDPHHKKGHTNNWSWRYNEEQHDMATMATGSI